MLPTTKHLQTHATTGVQAATDSPLTTTTAACYFSLDTTILEYTYSANTQGNQVIRAISVVKIYLVQYIHGPYYHRPL